MSGTTVASLAFTAKAMLYALCILVTVCPTLSEAAHRIGVLNPQDVPASFEEKLRGGLRNWGYVEGKNLAIEWRRTAGTAEERRAAAVELDASDVDLIVAIGSPATRAALDATTKPVVFLSGDPVGAGFAASLAKPGGKASGVSIQTTDLNRKRLELLRLLVPGARRIAYLANYTNPLTAPDLAEMKHGAQALGVQLLPIGVEGDASLDARLRTLRQSAPDGVVVSADFTLLARRADIARVIRDARIPAVFPYKEYHDAGALLSYGPNMEEVAHRLASYVHRVLTGARPGDLPVDQISRYEVVVDLRVAREMNIRLPREVLQRADEVLK